jgi:formylglycine-generating enzyme required for sulfatase activity
MKRIGILVIVCMMAVANTASADSFGTGDNQFTIDFVPISGSTNPTSGYGIVNNDYRMGTYEITNDQWNKFTAAYGVVKGSPSFAYQQGSYYTGTNVPTNCASWYEVAQFVNYLNTSTGHQAAYKFTGTQGTSNYTYTPWAITDTGYNVSNPFRNSKAFYFLPTEQEWVKAAYWNGTTLQTYATKAGETLFQGNGTNGGWNYDYYTMKQQPWNVGSGSEELNGTYDMMGNVSEWMESPYYSGSYLFDSYRGLRGGTVHDGFDLYLRSSSRLNFWPLTETNDAGFRVASIPEPTTLLLLGVGGLVIRRR